MKFRTARNALRFYFREVEALAWAGATRPDAIRVVDGGRRDRREGRRLDILTIGECLAALEPAELAIVRLAYEEDLSLAMIRAVLERLYPAGIAWTTRDGKISVRRNLSDEFLIALRRRAEEKVLDALGARGMVRR